MSESEPKALERDEIDRITREIFLLQKQERYLEATARAKKSVEDYPRIPAFWETYGDLLSEAQQWEAARDAYFEAKEIAKPNLNAERKYADMVYRISMKGMPISLSEDPPANATGAFLLSLIIPGSGQYYNGQLQKAIIFFVAWLVCVIPVVLIFTTAGRGALQALTSGPGLLLSVLVIGIDIAAAADAIAVARHAQEQFGPVFTSSVNSKKPTMPDPKTFFQDVEQNKKDL